MSEYEKIKVETELRNFASKNFVKPGDCRNIDQIRFYISELCSKIEEYDRKFNYVPQSIYSLLANYNRVQSNMIYVDFKNTYQARP
jgi:hypothetical protein